MEPLDVRASSPTASQSSARPEVAGVGNSPEDAASKSPGSASIQVSEEAVQQSPMAIEKSPPRRHSTLEPQTSWPDADSPITNLYLTFDTVLPAANTQPSLPDHDLPPCPDLSSYGKPTKMPNSRKNIMLFLSCVATCLTAYSAGAYSPPANLLAAEFGVSRTAVLTGITTFTAGFGIAPMVLAPFSEINGRYPVFVVSGIIFVIFQVVCGLVPNLAGMLVARFISGVGGSVFSTMVGGVIADLWEKEERNTPMALYSGAVLIGTGLGPLDASVMVYRWGADGVGAAAKWRWVFWHQAIADAVLVVALVVLFSESRGSVLLSRKARKLNDWYAALERQGTFGVWIRDASDVPGEYEETDASSNLEPLTISGNEKVISASSPPDQHNLASQSFKLQRIRWLVKEDEQRTSIASMISISLLRPFHLLFTEPAVFFFSLWVSFAWAVLYLTFGSVPLVFARQYDFNVQESGYVFITMAVGSILATAMGIYQESLLKHPKWQRKETAETTRGGFWSFMRRRFPAEAPESRLYFTCITSTFLPIGLYMFGFTAQSSIHWIVPTIAVAIATMGIYYIYLATFNYLADSYQTYASSALAAQSFCRNILGGAFPLVTAPLFINLGEGAAGGLLGAIATALTVVPWVLAFYGERIRRRSKFAVALERGQM